MVNPTCTHTLSERALEVELIILEEGLLHDLKNLERAADCARDAILHGAPCERDLALIAELSTDLVARRARALSLHSTLNTLFTAPYELEDFLQVL